MPSSIDCMAGGGGDNHCYCSQWICVKAVVVSGGGGGGGGGAIVCLLDVSLLGMSVSMFIVVRLLPSILLLSFVCFSGSILFPFISALRVTIISWLLCLMTATCHLLVIIVVVVLFLSGLLTCEGYESIKEWKRKKR